MISSSPSSSSKICFNPDCKEAKSERSRKGWRLRAGDFAELCDRCGSAYEEARFCDTFHLGAAGWRNCESCGKRVHCGCIVSVNTILLLDAGGVECIACAKKGFIMASNQTWPSSLFLPLPLPERLKDLSSKNWNQITGSSSIPGQWRQTPNFWNASSSHPELHTRMPYEVDRSNGIDKLNSATAVNTSRREEVTADGLQDSGHHMGENDAIDTRKRVIAESGLNNSAAGTNFETPSSSCVNISLQSSVSKDESATQLFGLAIVPFSSPNETNDPVRVSGIQSQRQTPTPPLAKQFYANAHSGVDSSGELQTQTRNGRPRGEGRGRNQLLPRYWPRITDQELQQISGDSNSVITPLFEKMLSASDAGRIGRLVLPKKCAEAYFPTISQPEGLPLKVQDAKGKDWVFQFRFWPNNNSRMYVLEGVTPCIQSMQLQAGDTVTFSRIDPEGKLVMGFRKASSVPSEQGIQVLKTGNGFSTSGEVNGRSAKSNEVISTTPFRPSKSSVESASYSSTNLVNPMDLTNTWSKFDKGCIPKERPGAKSSLLPNKRKSSTLGSKSKRLRIENDVSMELKLTWEEAQELLRPPRNHDPSIVVIEGHEFEEYEEAPVLGRPTIFTTNHAGEKTQWAQCEDCSKWRKLPIDALLPPRWTCSDNLWDPKRSSCSSGQELSTEQLEDLLSSKKATACKRTKDKIELDIIEASSDGLDTLANLAILGEDGLLPPSTQPTTKHPRHRPGCSCIVCIQPPSGKGPKHKQTCTCNVCLTVKRRFRTLMLRREKRQSEKEAETARKKADCDEEGVPAPTSNKSDSNPIPNEGIDGGDHSKKKSTASASPFKGRIDLNIQPEREEEPSPVSDSSNSMMKLLRDATAIYLERQRLAKPESNQAEPGGSSGEKLENGITHDHGLPDAEADHPVSISISLSASTSAAS